MQRRIIIGIAAVSIAAAAGISQAVNRPADIVRATTEQQLQKAWSPTDADVYVDRETRYAFIRTPKGWRFVRQIEAGKLALVPVEFLVPPPH